MPEVRRVDTGSLPYVSLRCLAYGHRWSDPPAVPFTGWGGTLDLVEEIAECECGRWRRDIVVAETGEVLARDYNGGTLCWAGCQPTRAEARVTLIAEKRSHRLAAVGTAS